MVVAGAVVVVTVVVVVVVEGAAVVVVVVYSGGVSTLNQKHCGRLTPGDVCTLNSAIPVASSTILAQSDVQPL